MAALREPIYAALWDVITANPAVMAPFVTKSRYTLHFEDVAQIQCPALFLLQTGERWERPGRGIPPKRTLRSKLVVVSRVGDTQELASPPINALLDYLDTVLGSDHTPQNVQTLGGLVEHVYVEGEIVIGEGLLQEASISYIPIAILIP